MQSQASFAIGKQATFPFCSSCHRIRTDDEAENSAQMERSCPYNAIPIARSIGWRNLGILSQTLCNASASTPLRHSAKRNSDQKHNMTVDLGSQQGDVGL